MQIPQLLSPHLYIPHTPKKSGSNSLKSYLEGFSPLQPQLPKTYELVANNVEEEGDLQ